MPRSFFEKWIAYIPDGVVSSEWQECELKYVMYTRRKKMGSLHGNDLVGGILFAFLNRRRLIPKNLHSKHLGDTTDQGS